MAFVPVINFKKPTNVDIRKFMARTKFFLMRLEHVKSVIILGLDLSAVWADTIFYVHGQMI